MVPRVPLNDKLLPAIGFGTYPLRGDEAICSALEIGYRLIDTAVNYGNEADVGRAVRQSGLARDDIRSRPKLPRSSSRVRRRDRSVEESLQRLQVDYLDLHPIHGPTPASDTCRPGALIDLRARTDPVRSAFPTSPRRTWATSSTRRAWCLRGESIELSPAFRRDNMRAVDTERASSRAGVSPMDAALPDEPAVSSDCAPGR